MVKSLLQASVLFGEAKARGLGGRVFKEAFPCFYKGESLVSWEDGRMGNAVRELDLFGLGMCLCSLDLTSR